jgi:hypothetical protein
VKLSRDPVIRQVTEIAQTISELRNFLPGSPEEGAFLVREVIADYDPRCTAFARMGNFRLPKTSSTPASLSRTETSSTVCWACVTFRKRHSFRSHVLFNPDEFDPSELLSKMAGRGFETGFGRVHPLRHLTATDRSL